MNNSLIKGPGIFLAQFLGDDPPFDNMDHIAEWISNLGYLGAQIPVWDKRVIDLEKASDSRDYCEEIKGKLAEHHQEVIELGAYLQGQCMALHPAYKKLFQPFYPKGLNEEQRLKWASDELKKTVDASSNMGTKNISVLSGGLAWPYLYPWPQRSAGLIDEAFEELTKRWMPLLNYAQEHGITFGFELHPGSDLFDGATYARFLELTNNHPAACITYDPSHFLLQQMDYLEFIEIFADRIKAFHVKDAEFKPSGLGGVYGSYADWKDRAGRFRSLGDGQVDFGEIFSLLTEKGYDGWAILEWECFLKSPEQGAREAVPFIRNHLIEVAKKSFDDFAKSETDTSLNRKILGLNS
jgi:sugar phosphate isomerase/epimerase